MAVKSGRLVLMMLDQQVLHGIIAFGRFLMLAGGKVSDHCYNVILLFMFTTDLYNSSTEAAFLEEMSVF